MIRDVLLGIDAGSSSVKVGAFSLDGKMVASCKLPVIMQHLDSGRVEIDTEMYWKTVRQLILKITGNESLNVLGIGFSTTCPTTICLDEDLAAVRPGIPYLDNRATAQVNRYAEMFSGVESPDSITGNRFSISTCSAANIMWIRDNEPETWSRTKSFGMLNSFLAAKLTGFSAVDCTQASYSGVFNLKKTESWDSDLLALAGIPECKMLPVIKPFERIGRVNPLAGRETGLPVGCPVAIGSADTAAAAFAIGLEKPGMAFESVGTSGVLSFVLDKPCFDPVFMNRCHIFPGKWLAHGAMSLMGGALEWIKKNIWPDFNSIAEMDDILLQSRPGANGVVFLPYLSGERCPIWDPEAVGVWYGMNLNTDKSDLIESVYESGAYAMKQIKDHAESVWGRKIESVVAVGNGTKGSRWNQIKADVLQVGYAPVPNADAAAYGAALMGGIAAGVFSGPEDPSIPRMMSEKESFHPCGKGEFGDYMKSYKIFSSLYPALRNVMHGDISDSPIESN